MPCPKGNETMSVKATREFGFTQVLTSRVLLITFLFLYYKCRVPTAKTPVIAKRADNLQVPPRFGCFFENRRLQCKAELVQNTICQVSASSSFRNAINK